MSDPRVAKTPEKPSRPRVGFWRWVWRISAGTFAVLVVLLALFIGLFRVAVPLFPDYQQRIEAAATNALGYPLSVGGVDARWRLRGPELLFNNVEVRTSDNSETLFEAESLRVAIDLMTLLKSGAINPSSLTLTGSKLDVRRDINGALYVQGLAVEDLRTDRPSTMPWGVANGLFGIRNLAIEVTDELRGNTLTIPDIDLDVSVLDTVLGVSGEFELERRGSRIEFSLDADGRADQSAGVVWTGFVAGEEINWSNIVGMLPEHLQWSTEEPVDASVWLRAAGTEVREANVSLDVRSINIADSDQTVARVAGRFSWVGNEGNWQLSGENVDISSSDDSSSGVLRLGMSTFRAVPAATDSAAVPPPESEKTQYTFTATELNLEELSWLAAPLSKKIGSVIEDYAPKGQIRELDGFVKLEDKALADFGVTATLNNIGVKGAEGRPGIEGINARVFGGRESGGVEISSASRLSLPGVIRHDVVIDSLGANVSWTHQDEAANIAVSELALNSVDLVVGGDVTLTRDTPEAEWLANIHLTVDRLDLANAYKYYPVNKFSGKLLNWLDNALTAGTGTDGRFTLEGPLKKFPFANPDDGNFTASLKLNDATLHYANNWPDATDITAVIEFERNSLRGQVEEAQLLTLPVRNAQATIEDLKKSVVFIEGSVVSQLDDMRAFLDATPIVKDWGQSWPDAQFYGDGTAQLSLTIPTKNRSDTQFDVALQFNDSRFQFRDWRHTVTDLRGEMRASRAGISGTGIRGIFMDEPVEIGVVPSPIAGYTSDVSLRGVAVPSSLARNLNESLADHLSGTTQWTANLSLPKVNSQAPLQVRVRSPLQGMAVTLPEPLTKSAEETRFTDVVLTVADETLLALNVDYGDDTNVMAQVRRGADGYWTVPRGELRFGGGNATLPEEDLVRVMGSVSELDMSQIVDFAKRNSSERPWIDFDKAELAVSSLGGLNQSFGATTVDMVHDSQGYQLNFVGERLSGALQVPTDITPDTPIVGQFEKLKWASTESNEPIDPSEAPSIRAIVDDFTYNDYSLGALVVHLEARANLVAVREFTTTTADFNTRTTGSWLFGDGESTTFLVSEFNSSNMKNTFSALGQAEFLDADSATARMEMSWPNGWTPDYLRTMEGELTVSIGQGKLLSVDPGAGRVFGLLSVGALPRRLNLDFRDVFDSGFGFDSITGDFVIRDGNADTENLALSGPAANVVIVGRTGLITKDYDQSALVYANFGSSLPLAGAIAGGPAVGAALLVVTEIFKKPLQSMGKVTYTITGPWDEPVVARTGSARPADNSGEAEQTPTAPQDDESSEGSAPPVTEGLPVEPDTAPEPGAG